MDAVLAIFGVCLEKDRYKDAVELLGQISADVGGGLTELLAGIGVIWRSLAATANPPRDSEIIEQPEAEAVYKAGGRIIARIGRTCENFVTALGAWRTWEPLTTVKMVAYLQAVDLRLRVFRGISAESRRDCRAAPCGIEEDEDGTFIMELGVNVRSKLREGFVDNLLLVEMQLMATLIKNRDPWITKRKEKKKMKKSAASERIVETTQQVCRDMCPRLLSLSTSLLSARVRDIAVLLAEASA
ncbi:unnamed protein product, partial [Sphacelaria rigidula]